MDGVLADFDLYMKEHNITPEEVKAKDGAYFDMKPIIGAIDGIIELKSIGLDVWIATKPPTGMAHAYRDKALWIYKHFPTLTEKIIMTPNKGLLGDDGDILIDDRIHRANCNDFLGLVVKFVDWKSVLYTIKNYNDMIIDRND